MLPNPAVIGLGASSGSGSWGAGLGVEIVTFEMQRGEDIDVAFRALNGGHTLALYVPPTPVAFVNRIRINSLALAAHVPTMFGVREYVEAGGLMSYGPNWPHMWGPRCRSR